MIKTKLRPAAVPLITVDPFFSIWSCSDNLYDDTTKHWTGRPCPILAGIYVDDWFYSMGVVDRNFMQPRWRVYQTGLEVTPLSTVYKFENEFAKVTLTFTTPLLLKRPDIFSRPVSYIKYDVERKCKEDKKLKFVFGINARACVNNSKEEVFFKKTSVSLACGNTVQNPLSHSGDIVMIDWGYLHLCDKDAFVGECIDKGQPYIKKLDSNITYNAYNDMPYLVVEKKELSGVIMVAYDEIYAVEYFGKPVKEYYTKFFESFEDMVVSSINEYEEIKKMCDEFDKELLSEAEKKGENYKNIVTLSYRQAVAAHKLIEDENGEIIYLSKECNSNGCIGTLDVTYPSIPIFLKYTPELVLGMLRPIIKYSKTSEWKYDFAPHDVGVYPLANGQVYGMELDNWQMPIEESGNMILCLAAVSKYTNKVHSLYIQEKELIKKWADYLVNNGYDPGNQLCTDDFAGHLNHNCNLSLKAIVAIGAYSLLSGDKSYYEIAKQYAQKWEKDAKNDAGATRLAFDKPDSWSLKYNMVWDNLLGLNLFSDEVKQNEIKLYRSKMNRYGVPLDSRKDYTKLDWLMWTTCLCDDKEYFNEVTGCVNNMICETTDRVPLTDWYYTSTAIHEIFCNRSVVGGVFINLL